MTQPQSAPTLEIELLGDFRLTHGKVPLSSVNTLRLQALLAYLVLHPLAPQSRQHLAFLFWPDSTEAKARNNLRQLLFDLRHALPDAERYLDTQGAMLQWRSDAPYRLDADDFAGAIADAARAARQNDLVGLREKSERAVLLYRGDLLPSCYDDWIAPLREHFRRLLIEALERLTALLETQRDYATALRYTQRLLQQAPLQETTYRQLMRLHHLSGDRAGVQRVYQICATILKRELEIPPGPETSQIYQQLMQSGDPTAIEARAPLPVGGRRNLPVALTNFIGRARETAEIQQLLARHRLLTLTGSGGVGKTRLALAVASARKNTYADGVWFVDLAPLSDPGLVPQTLAAVLDLRSERGRSLQEALTGYLRDKKMLILLDNCEHLVESCAQLAEMILQSARHVQFLVTSREPLGVPGEMAWRVPSLSVPSLQLSPASDRSLASQLLQYESVQLFLDRAATALPTFALTDANAADVLQICHALDGIPLGVELAAARLGLLSPGQIAARLDRQLHLLTLGSRLAAPRQRTVRATLNWSYDLLSDSESTFFQRLSVFAGGFTLEAAESVAETSALDLLARLVDKSLVVTAYEPSGAVRYRMLETIRQYALERLVESDAEPVARTSHLEFFVQFAEHWEKQLWGATQISALEQLESEHDNVRAALRWAIQVQEIELGLRLAGALSQFWNMRGYFDEGRAWLEQVLNLEKPPGRAQLALAREKAQFGLATCHELLGNWEIARSLYEQALAVARSHGDQSAISRALYYSAVLAARQCDCERAAALFNESLALQKERGDKKMIAATFNGLGSLARVRGDYDASAARFEDFLNLSRELQNQQYTAIALHNLGEVIWLRGDYGRAAALLEESAGLFAQIGDKRGVAFTHNNLGAVAHALGDDARARALEEPSLAALRELGDKRGIAIALIHLGDLACDLGEVSAAKCYAESLSLERELGNKENIAFGLEGMSRAACAQSLFEQAARLLGAAEAARASIGAPLPPVYRRARDQIITALETQLDETSFKREWDAGSQMTAAQAIQYALSTILES